MAKFNGTVENIEDNRNKVTQINENSTDTQYPSAKCVYDFANGCLKLTNGYYVANGWLSMDNLPITNVGGLELTNASLPEGYAYDKYVGARAYNDLRYLMQNAKVTEISDNPTDNQIPTAKAVKDYVDESGGGDMTAYLKRDGTLAMTGNLNMDNHNIANIGNLVTSISSSSTDNQIPSAKCVYDAIQDALYVDTSTVIIPAEV